MSLPPSGSSGFILGEILGLNAGLTSAELTLFLFLLFRANFGSGFFAAPNAKAGLVGDAIALSAGLCFPDNAALAEGVLKGPSFGVFLADMRGVDSPSSRIPASTRDNEGPSKDASGRIKSSSRGGT